MNEEGGSDSDLREKIMIKTGKSRSVDNTNLDRGGPKTYTGVKHWELASILNHLPMSDFSKPINSRSVRGNQIHDLTCIVVKPCAP